MIKEGIVDGSLRIEPSLIQLIGVSLPNTILSSVQRLICRESVYKLEYGYTLQDLYIVAELLVNGIK